MTQALSMYVGDTKTFNFAVTDNAAPVDITGWTFSFAASSTLTASPPFAFRVTNASFQILNGPGGLGEFTIPTSMTKALGLTADTLFNFALIGIETGGAEHTLAAGSLAIRLTADDVTP